MVKLNGNEDIQNQIIKSSKIAEDIINKYKNNPNKPVNEILEEIIENLNCKGN